MASFMPFSVGRPSEASPPDKGRSIAILTVSPLKAAPPPVEPVLGAAVAAAVVGVVSVAPVPPDAAGVAVGDSVPHALKSMLKARIRAAIKANLEDFIVETL